MPGILGVVNVSAYKPAPHTLRHLAEVDFVGLVGPTAAGKTTLIKAAAAKEPELHMLVAGVSRSPRPGEQDGVDYHFGDKKEMEQRVRRGEYITAVHGATGDLYTTAPEDYPPGKITLMALLAHAVPLFRSLPYRSFRTVFVTPPSAEAWRERWGRHSFSPDELARRLREAEVSLTFAISDATTYFIVNEDLATATEDLITLALNGLLPPRLRAAQAQGREIAGQLLAELRRQ